MDKKIVALIPLRGGSKSILYKNIKLLAGKPLAYWVCKAATASKLIDKVYVSTEDEKIIKIIESFKLGINVINRPKELATDIATTEDVLWHFASSVEFDVIVTLQATSPFTTPLDLDKALSLFFEKKYDSMLTGIISKRFYWHKTGVPINYDYKRRPRRQDFEGTVIENGAFYITKKEVIERYKNRLGGKIGIFIMPDYTELELDEPYQWDIVENLLLQNLKYQRTHVIRSDRKT